MKYYKSFISIRSRSHLEILDLSLQVVRSYFWQLLIYLGIGAGGFSVLNHLVLWNTAKQGVEPYSPTQYGLIYFLLVVTEAQMATIWMTSFLGQAMFVVKPKFKNVVGDVGRVALGLFWIHGILRLGAVIVLLIWLGDFDPSFNTWGPLTLTLALIGLLLSVGIRTARPFATEILVLERTPFHTRSPDSISYGRRSSTMHSRMSSESLGIAFLFAAFGGLLLMSVYGFLVVACRMTGLLTDPEWPRVFVIWPLALWLAAGLGAVVRFLFYVDSRIRQEGWEVELKIRAAAMGISGEGSAG